MFDATGAFTRQFTPVSGGYLYYPSRRGGGKLVTTDEYERLVSEWRRVAGNRGQWKTVGFSFLAIMVWAGVSQVLNPPAWTDSVVIAAFVATISAWIMWASWAPRRLVKSRPDFAPPRPGSKARREDRAALNWPFVVFILLFSGAIFVGSLVSDDAALTWWAWVIGSGLFFSMYVLIAFQKLMDRKG